MFQSSGAAADDTLGRELKQIGSSVMVFAVDPGFNRFGMRIMQDASDIF